MKRLSGLLLVGVLLCAAVVSAQASIQTATTQAVRFRAGPGTDWRILTTLEAGTPIHIDARDGTNNYWVRGIVPGGQVGWTTSQALSVTEAQLNALPIKLPDEPFNLPAPAADAAPEAAPQEAPPAEEPAEGETPAEAAAPPAAQSLAPMSGFAYGGHVQGFGPAAVSNMQRAGMTWAKKQVRYTDGANPAEVAGLINDAKAKGFRILLGVVGNAGQINNPGYNERYAEYVGGLAALGADGIEIWNEPNIDREWPAGQIDPAAYTQLLAASYNSIKANNPATLVISGAPAPTGFFSGCSGAGCDDLPFIQGMAAAGAANYMDCVGVHYNEGIVPPTARSGDPRGNSGYYTRYFQPMIETYSGAFGGAVPLCFTEMGYLTPEGYGPLPGGFAWAGDVSVAEQAQWLDSAVSIARRSGRVRLIIIWNVDFTGYGADPMGGYAIIRPDGSCPACDALGS